MKRMVFRIKREWPIGGKMRELWPMFLSGEKKSEFRDATDYWQARLIPKPDKAWLVVGFPKGSIPRLEADVIDVIHHEDTEQYEVVLENVVEVTVNPMDTTGLTRGKIPDAELKIKIPDEFRPLIEDIRFIDRDGQNPNRMTKKKREGLWRSLVKYGWFKPILANDDGLLGDGEQRLDVLLEHEEYFAPVLRLDIDDPDRRLLRQIANKMGGIHDPALDALEYRRIDEEGGRDGLIKILQIREKELREALEAQEVKEEEYELPALEAVETDIVAGDMFALGDHILLCGDSTDPESLLKVMRGEKADMGFSDPPYNVDYASTTEFRTKIRRGPARSAIEGDKVTDIHAFLYDWLMAMAPVMAEYNSVYISFAEKTMKDLLQALEDADYYHSQTLVWNKNAIVLSRSDYYYKHEPIVYCWKNKHKFYGKSEKTVWDIERPAQSKLHPTMKPVELVARAVTNSSMPEMRVLDCFGGSGSTLIACEQLGRRGHMIELDPRYCQIIIDRWQAYSGKEAVPL